MSSSWTRESPMNGDARRSDRAQASPIAALVALFAVCAGVSLYATVIDGSIPAADGRNVAESTLDRVHDVVNNGGVVDPEPLSDAEESGPDGRRLNVTLTTDTREWSVGPPIPTRATDRASRLVSVRLAPGRVEPGRLSAVVWS